MTTSARRSLATRAGVAVAAVAALAAPAAAGAAERVAPRAALFAAPSSIGALGPWIVVSNRTSDTLTVLLAADGHLAGRVSHTTLGVTAPSSLVAEVVGGRRLVFVAGRGGNVAELALTTRGAGATATRLRMLHPSGCARRSAAELALGAHGSVVEACTSGVVTEWRASMGAVERSIPATTSRLTDATDLAVVGADAYVTNRAGATAPDEVVELSLATGARVRAVTNATSATYAFSAPTSIATDGTHLWEVNATGSTVDELTLSLGFVASSSTNLSSPGAVLATRAATYVSSSGAYSMVTQFTVVGHALTSPWMMCNTNGPYEFGNPSGFAVSGGSLWVSNASDSLVDQMNASSGALVATYR